jgi:hypothetical protein
MVQGIEPRVLGSITADFLVRHCLAVSDCRRWIRIASRVQLFADHSTCNICLLCHSRVQAAVNSGRAMADTLAKSVIAAMAAP